MKRRATLCVLILLVAGGARTWRLADRPMHADEAVLADKLGTLVETGVWRYDPHHSHGPALLYVTAAAAWLSGCGKSSS